MIKREYIELIQRNVAGGEVTADQRGKYHEEIVSRYIGMAYDTYLWQLVSASTATRDLAPLDSYTKPFEIPKSEIKEDKVRKQLFIDLPVAIPQLMGNQAIRYVGPAPEGSRGWLYRNPSAHDVFTELDVELVDQTTRYSREIQRIYFYLLHQIPDVILLKIIPGYEGYADTDDLPMPGGQDFFIFPQIVELLKGRPDVKEDLGNDNVINADSLGGSR